MLPVEIGGLAAAAGNRDQQTDEVTTHRVQLVGGVPQGGELRW